MPKPVNTGRGSHTFIPTDPVSIGSSASLAVIFCAPTSFSAHTRSRKCLPYSELVQLAFQSNAVPSAELVIILSPLGLNPALRTGPLCPLKKASDAPVVVLQRITV